VYTLESEALQADSTVYGSSRVVGMDAATLRRPRYWPPDSSDALGVVLPLDLLFPLKPVGWWVGLITSLLPVRGRRPLRPSGGGVHDGALHHGALP